MITPRVRVVVSLFLLSWTPARIISCKLCFVSEHQRLIVGSLQIRFVLYQIDSTHVSKKISFEFGITLPHLSCKIQHKLVTIIRRKQLKNQ